MQEFYSAYFAAEIFEAVLSNGDGRKKGQKASSVETVDLAEKLFQQECSGLIPEIDKKHLSYISLTADGEVARGDVIDLIVQASEEILPVQLDSGAEYTPYEYNFIGDGLQKYSYSTGWKEVPGYGASSSLFPVKPGFDPWFGIFSDTIGIALFFYYPKNPSGIIEVPYSGIDLGGFKIYWKHGVPGLSKILQVVFFEWLIRNYSYGLVTET